MSARNFFVLPLLTACMFGQAGPANPKVDPLALQVLKAAMDSVKGARVFSFRAVVNREVLGTNDELLTFSQQSVVTMSRPNRFRMQVRSDRQPLDIYYDAGQITLYAPDKKLYSGFVGGTVLELYLKDLEARDFQLPLAPLFRADPYTTVIDGLERAAVIGRADIDGKTYHQLSFGEKEADWQMWVEAGAKPLPRRVQIVYKTLRREPRVTIDFYDWNLAVNQPASFFVFQKPEGAKYIDFLDASSANPQSVLARISRRGESAPVLVQNRSAGGNAQTAGAINHDSDWDLSMFVVGGAPASKTLSVVPPAVGTVMSTLPGGCTGVADANVALYNCKGVYLKPFYQGSSLMYRVVMYP